MLACLSFLILQFFVVIFQRLPRLFPTFFDQEVSTVPYT